jgi:hypothetical protein
MYLNNMEKDIEYKETYLSTKQTIEALILNDLKQIVYTTGAPYIKFLFFPIVIEYLGACLDYYAFNENGHSEERFNKSLNKLFPNKYKEFTKSDSKFYMYEGFRCNMIHRLKPENYVLTTREEAKNDHNQHLVIDTIRQEKICLILEDFYDDIVKAVNKLTKMFKNGKAPKQKENENQIRITSKQQILPSGSLSRVLLI